MFALTTRCALSSVSCPNCSMYACAAVSSMIASSFGYSCFVYWSAVISAGYEVDMKALWLTCSSLSINLVVYSNTSTSLLCSCLARIWLTTKYSPGPRVSVGLHF